MPIIAIAAAAALLALLGLTPLIDRQRQRALRRIVSDVCRLFDEHAIDYWCDFGTLLGLHRDGDIIAGDKDADLCVLSSEKPRILALAAPLGERGYVLTDRGGRSRTVLRIHDARTWYHLDVYEYVPDGDVLRSVLVSPQEDIPARLVTSRRRVTFLDAPVHIPCDAEAVLRHRYGPGFARPRRGDKGATRPYSFVRSVLEDLQDNVLGLGSMVRSALYRLSREHGAKGGHRN